MADASQHRGNIQPFLDLEEHDGVNNAKKVNVVAGTLSGGQATITPLQAWPDPKTYIGLVTVGNAVNVDTNKTFIHKTLEMSTASIATIAVPTNTFKTTNLVISSNATTRVNIKSGPTYLTGNASIGIMLNPAGGWVESGTPLSPTYIGLADAAALVVEKFDADGIVSTIGGKIIYFDE